MILSQTVKLEVVGVVTRVTIVSLGNIEKMKLGYVKRKYVLTDVVVGPEKQLKVSYPVSII